MCAISIGWIACRLLAKAKRGFAPLADGQFHQSICSKMKSERASRGLSFSLPG